ncbi:MAG: hypothetical protein RL150_481 [Candidatus Parcubacteria bacterium]|jgi:O-antigen ligase/tetratricopeptide (TPR) repeat protein
MTLKKALFWIAAGSVFAALLTPLIFYTELYFPFITAKAYFFRVVSALGFFAWVGLAVLDPAYRPRRSWILGTFTAFMLVVLLASVLGTNPYYSFWSNYERMEGYVTFLHLFAFLLVASSVLTRDRLWSWFAHAALVCGAIEVLWAALQVAGIFPIGFAADRIDGTLGNATYLAIYLVFTFFIALMLLVQRSLSPLLQYVYGASMLLSVLGVFWTATRGSLLGLIGGIVLTAVLYSIFGKNTKNVRMVTGGVLGLALVFAVLVIGFKESAVVQSIPALRRVADISFTETTTIARFYNWETAWQGVTERPLLGYGLGNYGPVFDKYYNPKMWNQEQWFDRVHNIVFDWLIAAGFLGLIAYVSVIAALVYLIWKKSSTFTMLERAVLTGLVAAYCFHNLFVFDNLVSYIYFMALLAFVHARSTAGATPVFPATPVSYNVAGSVAIVLVVIAFPLSAWALNVPSYKQSALLIDALRVDIAKNLPEAKRLFEEALSYDTFGTTETRQQLISLTDHVVRINSIPVEERQAFVTFAASEMQKELDTKPRDAKFLAFAGQLLLQTGNFEQSMAMFNEAIALAPNKQFLYQPLIETIFRQGKLAEGLALAQRVHDMEPSNDLTWRQLVRSSLRAGNVEQYDALIEEAFATGRGDRVIGLAQQNLESQPDVAQAYATLAISLYRAGKNEEAIKVFTELGTKFPGAQAQTDALIEKIKRGEPLL